MQNLDNLDPNDYAVVDLATGTVVGPHSLVLIPWPADPLLQDRVWTQFPDPSFKIRILTEGRVI